MGVGGSRLPAFWCWSAEGGATHRAGGPRSPRSRGEGPEAPAALVRFPAASRAPTLSTPRSPATLASQEGVSENTQLKSGLSDLNLRVWAPPGYL